MEFDVMGRAFALLASVEKDKYGLSGDDEMAAARLAEERGWISMTRSEVTTNPSPGTIHIAEDDRMYADRYIISLLPDGRDALLRFKKFADPEAAIQEEFEQVFHEPVLSPELATV